MLTLTSNLPKVILQMQALKDAVPQAVARALQPGKWEARAREVAEKTLMALSSADENEHVIALLKRISSGPLPGLVGFYLRMDARKDGSLFAAQQNLPGVNAANPLNLTGLSPQDFMELLRRWVMTPEEDGGKRRDERDAGKSDGEIVDHLMRVFFAPSGNGIPGSEEGLNAARAGLMPHIVAFYQGEMAGTGAKPERIDEWLRSVLVAWRMMVREEITARIRAELKAKKFP